MTKRGMKPFNLTMEWGQKDEGLYHWSGRARDIDHALKLAREEMDANYNEQYCRDPDDEFRRGIGGGDDATEYVLSDYSEGVNEFAASDMLDALKMIHDTYILDAEDQDTVRKAIDRGEGRY